MTDENRAYRAFKIRPDGLGPWLFVRTLDEVAEHLREGEDDDLWDIETLLMSDAELAGLPEFDGW